MARKGHIVDLPLQQYVGLRLRGFMHQGLAKYLDRGGDSPDPRGRSEACSIDQLAPAQPSSCDSPRWVAFLP